MDPETESPERTSKGASAPAADSKATAPSAWRRLVQRARDLWVLLWKEHTTPREIGVAVAAGVFVGCTPAFGLHGWIALGLATLFRLNRIWCWLGSRVSSFLIYPWIVIGEIELGHHLRFGGWMHLTEKEVMQRKGKLMLDWLLGSLPIGVAAALVLGLVAFGLAHLRKPRSATADAVDLPENTADPSPR